MSQPKIIQDLKVKVHYSTILLPAQKTQRRRCFLSNLDQHYNFYASTLHFFTANPNFPPQTVVQRLKTGVQKVMVPYDFAAGSVRLNHQLGRLEIDCDATGAGFVVASSEFSLDEIGDLVCANPGYLQLAPVKLDNLGPNTTDQPLCIFQVTSFKCGGFSMSFSTSHHLFDGMAARMFLENVASQAFDQDKPLAIVPRNDRHLLVARSPPCVEFLHHEFKLTSSRPNDIIPVQEEIVSKIFKLSSNQINYLKDKAKSGSSTGTKPIKITSFNVVVALIWRCKALSTVDVENNTNKDRASTLLFAVDIRSRLNPPLPSSYCGNAVLNAYASSKCIELEERPFFEIVGEVYAGLTRVTDEYVRSTIDWLEINKGVPNRDYFISSWTSLGFEQVVYPWGNPIYSLPVVSNNKYVCFLLPHRYHNDNGMNVVVTLPPRRWTNSNPSSMTSSKIEQKIYVIMINFLIT